MSARTDQQRTPPVPHVLVVEDDLDLRDLFVTVAHLQGYTAEGAVNGSEGLRMLRASGATVVVLDLMMPIMSGWEFRRCQLLDPAIASVPVLCVSAIADLQQVAKTLRVHCMQKPIDPEPFADKLRVLCEGAGHRAP